VVLRLRFGTCLPVLSADRLANAHGLKAGKTTEVRAMWPRLLGSPLHL